ncbi:hypothetical protein [Natrarchaeobaculum sulfurireducens]|uniref:Outer membrane protein n=1 Tax=Natrarchaeobaculum sulfurireducens TaxID=2044521 RepID=A0A346PPP1_9EURY|nr:hypothetical protein [Natrarchaeobaculum sulfurireducens]AXR81486.1 Outer membrane protein [Natrarchaeobaculum sulfurireducens]
MRTITDGDDPLFAADVLNYVRNFPQGTLVLGTDGCEVSANGDDMELTIEEGEVAIHDVVETMPTGTVEVDEGEDYDRFDLVVVEENGDDYEYAIVKGQTEMVTPTLQSDQVLLAIVYVAAGTSSLATGDVNDARLLSTRTEDDGSFNTLQVLEPPEEDDDVARKAELDEKSDQGHDHDGEEIRPDQVETPAIVFTDDQLVIGDGAEGDDYDRVVVLGNNAAVSGQNAVAIGNNAETDSSQTTAVGHETDAEGTGATALGQLADALGTNAVAIRGAAGETNAIAIGVNTDAAEESSVAVGDGASVEGPDSVAVGTNASVGEDDDNALAMGADSEAGDRRAVVYGASAEAGGHGAVAIGFSTLASALSSTAIGRDAEAIAQRAVAIGRGAVATNDGEAHIACDQLRYGANAEEEVIDDQDLDEGEMTAVADEDEGEFQLRYKDSDGDIQTGTISFD